jgi:hypothetical protein
MTVTIGRRELLAALGGAAAWPLAATAELPISAIEGSTQALAPAARWRNRRL